MQTPLRALLAARLSVMTDESTSPVRQLEHGRSAVQARGWTEAGVATDLDVSATKYSPFDRPELGNWLKNRHHEFDVIVVRRLDRLVRSSKTRSWSGYVPVPPDRTLGVPASQFPSGLTRPVCTRRTAPTWARWLRPAPVQLEPVRLWPGAPDRGTGPLPL
ncbi:recombinase family protein [Streptomyces gardneri]|nr:recombinase family protein [Streptomyces gardneri]UAK33042.1 recombinase family protein [Nocardia asteroides]